MAVSEEEIKEEEIIQEDFKKAREIYNRIVFKVFANKTDSELPTILFALCLIYAQQLRWISVQNERKYW